MQDEGSIGKRKADSRKALERAARSASRTRSKRSSASTKPQRWLAIIDALQSGRVYNSQELARLCGVSRRTVFRDVAELQRAGLNVGFDEVRQGYYLPHRLSLPPSELTVTEALALLLICQQLGGTAGGIPFLEAARSAAWKVCQTLPPHIRDRLAGLSETVSISLDSHHPQAGAQQHYELILRALIERRQLRIDYDGAPSEGALSTVVSPYRVIFRRRGWYAVGRSSVHRQIRVFHLGRIRRSELLEDDFEIPPRFSLERFLGNAWQVIRGSEPVEVVVRFHPQVAPTVADVRWHKSQRLEFLPDGGLDYRVTVDGTDEISWWILGYGDQAEVLEPQTLRERIRRHAENMLKIYASSASDN